MSITIPKSDKPNHGLHRVASGTYYVRWYENGKQRIRSTETKDVKEARQIRDRLYARFESEKGALRVGSVAHAVSCDRYIYERPPYLVKVPGHKVREAETRIAARDIRNQLLGLL